MERLPVYPLAYPQRIWGGGGGTRSKRNMRLCSKQGPARRGSERKSVPKEGIAYMRAQAPSTYSALALGPWDMQRPTIPPAPAAHSHPATVAVSSRIMPQLKNDSRREYREPYEPDTAGERLMAVHVACGASDLSVDLPAARSRTVLETGGVTWRDETHNLDQGTGEPVDHYDPIRRATCIIPRPMLECVSVNGRCACTFETAGHLGR